MSDICRLSVKPEVLAHGSLWNTDEFCVLSVIMEAYGEEEARQYMFESGKAGHEGDTVWLNPELTTYEEVLEGPWYISNIFPDDCVLIESYQHRALDKRRGERG